MVIRQVTTAVPSWGMPNPILRRPGGAGVVAVILGLSNAAVSAFWLFGGTALLDTVGGEIEQWGRERGASVLVALTGVVLVKVAIAIVPLVDFAGLAGRWVRRLGWVAAVILVVYGGLLTTVGLLVQFGVVDTAAEADAKALAWHAFFWDPWFLLWGVALVLHLSATAIRTTTAGRTSRHS